MLAARDRSSTVLAVRIPASALDRPLKLKSEPLSSAGRNFPSLARRCARVCVTIVTCFAASPLVHPGRRGPGPLAAREQTRQARLGSDKFSNRDNPADPGAGGENLVVTDCSRPDVIRQAQHPTS